MSSVRQLQVVSLFVSPGLLDRCEKKPSAPAACPQCEYPMESRAGPIKAPWQLGPKTPCVGRGSPNSA